MAKIPAPHNESWMLPVVASTLIVCVHLVLLSEHAILPFVDLPQHLAMAELLAHRTSADVAELYDFRLFPQVNILHLLLATPLVQIFPEFVAVRIMVGLYLAGLAGALLWLTHALGTSGWNAVIGLLFAIQFSLMWGFMSFCLGLPLLLVLLAQLARSEATGGHRDRASERARALLFMTVLWFALTLAHVLLTLFGLLALGSWILLGDGRRRDRLRHLLPTIPAVFLIVLWYLETRGVMNALAATAAGSGVAFDWHDPLRHIAVIGWSLIVNSGESAVQWLVVLLVTVFAARSLWLEYRDRRSNAGSRDRHRWLRATAVMAFVLFMVLPSSVSNRAHTSYGLFLLYHRFLILLPLVLIPTLEFPPGGRWRKAAVIGVLALHVGLGVSWARVLDRSSAAAAGLDGALDVIPPGKVLKSLIYTPFPDGVRYASMREAASYYQARKLGEVNQSFALLPVSPIHYKDPSHPYLSTADEHGYPDTFEWRKALLYDYILIFDRHGEWSRFYAGVPIPVRYRENGWIVLDVDAARRGQYQ